MRRALVTGVTGQDGAYLAKLLLERNYHVTGTHRPGGSGTERLEALGISAALELRPMDLGDATSVRRLVDAAAPDEVYNLAGQSFVGASFDAAVRTADINAVGPLRLLEALRAANPSSRFCQASSAEIFGPLSVAPQSESTALQPCSPYGVSKAYAHWITICYRQMHGLFACAGILFNHESELRGQRFVTRKISDAVARIALGRQERLVLGNLDARRDWGYAPEYMEALWLSLQQPTAEEYVIATGETHSVRDFVEAAFARIGVAIRWSGRGSDERGWDSASGRMLVEVSPDLFRPTDAAALVGDAGRARRNLGWQARTPFSELVNLMVDADLRRLTQGGTG